MIELNQDQFQHWLKRKDPLDVVGFAGTPLGCPLSNWYTAAVPHARETYVGTVVEVYDTDGLIASNPLQDWERRFQVIVDLAAEPDDIAPITAGYCLRVLNAMVTMDAPLEVSS